jgi:hypothetical protein
MASKPIGGQYADYRPSAGSRPISRLVADEPCQLTHNEAAVPPYRRKESLSAFHWPTNAHNSKFF